MGATLLNSNAFGLLSVYSRPVNTTSAGPRRRLPIVLWPLLAVVALGACAGPEVDSHQAVAHRLIAEPTDEVFDLTALRRSYGYQHQGFASAGQLRRWRTRDAERAIEDGWLVVRPPGGSPEYVRLSHEIDLFTEDVREIVVVARGLRQGLLRLFWAIPGAGFVNERGLWLEGKGAGEAVYRFEVAGHEAWRGRIHALRLDLPNVAGQEVHVRSFETRGDPAYEAELLARVVAQDWKMTLGSEARNAVLVPPDVPRRWRLPAPAAGRLRFAYGLPASGGGPGEGEDRAVRFEVSAEVGGERRTLFAEAVDPGDPTRAGRWLEAEVELSPTGADAAPASEVAELIFETSAPAGYRIEAGLPAWANPEILVSAGGERRPNVILISIDTLRADRLGIYGYDQATSPNIDRWARSSAVTFSRAVATAPWTLPSHVSMLTGLDALRHGVNHHLAAPRELELLAETLRRQGYLTAAVTGGGWLHPDRGLAQGFDVFNYWGRGTAAEHELEAGIERALELLEEGRERELFLFFHTYEAHDPFRRRLPWAERCPPPSEDAGEQGWLYGAVEEERQKTDGFPVRYGFRKWRPGQAPVADGLPISDAALPLVSCLYDSGIAWVDRHLGRLFERLEALDPDRRTLVVLTSDHGESLGEYGLVKHAYLFDSNLLVPLIVRLPGGDHSGETVEAQVSLVDVVPTILAVAGVEPAAGLDGSSLLPLIAGRGERAAPRQAWSYAGSTNYGLSLRLDDRAKYIYNNTAWTPLGGTEQLYDLRADAGERSDQAPASPERVAPLRARLLEALERNAQGVRVQIENHSCGELAGELAGLPMHISRVKAGRPPGARLEYLTRRRSAFRLPPGESLDLLLEAARGIVTVEGGIGPCAGAAAETGFRQPLDLDRLEVWGLGFDGAAWREDLAAEDPRPGGDSLARVVVRREGRSVTEPGDSQELDPALVEQLKALGYLND